MFCRLLATMVLGLSTLSLSPMAFAEEAVRGGTPSANATSGIVQAPASAHRWAEDEIHDMLSAPNIVLAQATDQSPVPSVPDEQLLAEISHPTYWPRNSDGEPIALLNDTEAKSIFERNQSDDQDVVEQAISHLQSCFYNDRKPCRADGTMDEALMQMLTDSCPDDPSACVALGLVHDLGVQTEESDELANVRYRSACEGSDARGCYYWALSLLATDTQRASQLLDEACQSGYQDGCVEAGINLLYGSGVEQDVPAGLNLLVGACNSGSWYGCQMLGYVQNDESVSSDPAWTNMLMNETINLLLERVCLLDDYHSCVDLGIRFDDGSNNLEVNTENALKLYNRACAAGGIANACQFWFDLSQEVGDLPPDEPDFPDFSDQLDDAGVLRPDFDIDLAVQQAERHPLGSELNPIRVNGVFGQHLYLSRLRCGDGMPPVILGRGSNAEGVFQSFVDVYQLDCGEAFPGRVTFFMDLYHLRREHRAADRFALDPTCQLIPEEADLSRYAGTLNAEVIEAICKDRADLEFPPSD